MSLSVSNLIYKGNATIKIVKGNKVVTTVNAHNSGETLLFKAIASALCGNNIKQTIPRFLSIGKFNINDEWTPSLAMPVSVSGRVVENENVLINGEDATVPYGALFTAFIPSSLIIGDSQAIQTLRILADVDSKFPLARINLDTEQQALFQQAINNLSGAYSVIIEWLMIVQDGVSLGDKVSQQDQGN